MKIIDADGHILDKEKDIRPHLPEAHRRRGGSLVPSLGVDARLEIGRASCRERV